MDGTRVRIAGPGDEGRLDAFLAAHADSSLFLRSNLRRGGVVDRGDTYQATYAVAERDGLVTGVVAHTWLGMLMLQVPDGAGIGPVDVARAAMAASGRRVEGLLGPNAQCAAARDGLGLGPPARDMAEDLFSLDLARLSVPPALAAGRVSCRPMVEADLPVLVPWRMAYGLETGVRSAGPDLEPRSRVDMLRVLSSGDGFVLEQDGALVAYCAYNARIPDTVQVGGVWTPPALRGQGHARAVVAGALLAARAEGTSRAVLFTGTDNHAAQRAYQALGFRRVGDYGIVLY